MDSQTPAALPARDRPYKVGVGGSLFLLVQPNGSKWWRFRYRIGGREKGASLGVFPTVSLAEAVKARDRMKAQLRAGTDPMQARRAQRLTRLKRLAESSKRELHLALSKDGALTIGTGNRLFRLNTRQTKALRAFLLAESESESK